MKQRTILALLLAVVMLLILPSCQEGGDGQKKEPQGALEYTLSEDGSYYSVTGIGTCKESVVIPATYNDLPVREIADGAFFWERGLKSVVIPNGVARIGDHAFETCDKLAYIEIPDSVTCFGEGAFNGCDLLEDIHIPNGVTCIERMTFGYCSRLKNVRIPDSVTNIGDFAFGECDSLTNIEIPNSVTEIGLGAFFGCNRLENITVAEDHPTYRFSGGALYTKDGTVLIQYAPGRTESFFSVPEGVVSIAPFAFAYCANLKEVTIPDSVTDMGRELFDRCTNLVSVRLPNGLEVLPSGLFLYCKNLVSVTLPDGLVKIDWMSFAECTSLESVVIPTSVKTIDRRAFMDSCDFTVYYKGAESEWLQIKIDFDGNEKLKSASRYYFSASNSGETGNFWHYDENGNPVPW